MPRLSIIIPIFNAEKYLDELLTSILSQSFTDFEVICVDDGSKDNSLNILKKYKKNDPRIKIIEQKNQGAGTARNKGITISKGEYLHFVDADDSLFQDAYSKLFDFVNKHHNPNIIRFRGKAYTINNKYFPSYYETNNIYQEFLNKKLDIKNNLNHIIQLPVVPWLGIIKREFVINNNLMFNDLKVCNDRSFYMTSVISAKELFLSDIIVVKHKINNKESLLGKRHKHIDCMIKSIYIIKDFINQTQLDENIQKSIIINEIHDLFYFYNIFVRKNLLSYKAYKEIIEFIKNFNIEELRPNIESVWYYWTFKRLRKTKSKLILLKYIANSIISVYSTPEYYLRFILFHFIKFKIKLKK